MTSYSRRASAICPLQEVILNLESKVKDHLAAGRFVHWPPHAHRDLLSTDFAFGPVESTYTNGVLKVMSDSLEFRLLKYIVAVAETFNFHTRC